MSLEDLLIQYLQSNIHLFVSRIFNKDMHLPSAEKLWQIPHDTALPSPDPLLDLSDPLEVHATSYLAAAARIFSFSINDILLDGS